MSNGTVVSEAIGSLRLWLQSANLKSGDRIPSERHFMSQLGLTHNAVNRAMLKLIAEGKVRRDGYKLYYADGEESTDFGLVCDLIMARRSLYVRRYRKLAKTVGVELRMHYFESVDESVAHLQRLNVQGAECVLFDPPSTLSAATWAPPMRQLHDQGIPAVSIGQYVDGVSCVLRDYARAVRQVYAYLKELGHVEMALFTHPPRASTSIEILTEWESLPWGVAGRASAKRVAFYEDVREDVQILAQKLACKWNKVTALVVHSLYDPVVPHLLDELAAHGKSVPEDLSIVALGDLPHLSTSVPAISVATFDYPLIYEIAFRLAQRLVREKQRTGLLLTPSCTGIHPGLVLRESARSMHGVSRRVRSVVATERGEYISSDEPRQELRAMLRRPYQLTLTAAPERFESVDLTPFVNRSLHYRKGWFGDLPLTHLRAGKQHIHRIPFEVLGGAKRTDNGVITFRSRTNERGNARELPTHVRIPINSKAKAIYVLHGCGYTRFLSPFATYEFYAGRKKLGEVKMVALGRPRYDWNSEQFEKDAKKANIQDWWGDFPHPDFDNARQVPILPPEDDAVTQRYAYLYTLEWKNPFPERKVSHIDVKVDATQSTTLGVIAMTLFN